MNYKTLTIIALILCSQWLHGIPYNIDKTRISDGWQFVRGDMSSTWELFRPVRPDQPESVPIWQNVTIPHCFNANDAVDPDVNYYQGVAWYKNVVEVNNTYSNGKTLLEFEGAGPKTSVYLYTTLVGSHIGGYDRWTVDITEAVKKFQADTALSKLFGNKIPIAIKCDNSRDAEMIPSNLSDFNIYGGLYRHVNIVYLPQTYIESISINSNINGDITITPFVKGTQPYTLEATLIDPNGTTVATFKGTSAFKTTIKKPLLWSTERPLLYTCNVVLTTNRQTISASERFGFRSISFAPHGPFLLNGKETSIRGTHRHEDHAGVGSALTDEMMRHEMQQIKDMGANFIRLGHYQQSELILQLCDELGIMVWEEIPWCRGGLGGDSYQNQARQMLTNMINQHKNHPSVIIWGLGNENDWPNDFETFDKNNIRAFMQKLNDIAHNIDSSRYTSIRRCDFCKEIPDLYSPSIWAGWYSQNFKDYTSMAQRANEQNEHFFHAEWGGDSHPNRFTESNTDTIIAANKNGDWSENYITRLFDWHLKELEKMPYISSAFWTFKDFSTPIRPENPIPYVNQKGVVQRDGTPKEVYYTVQSYWSKKPMVHILGHSWPIRWGKPNEPKEILVYSNCNETELFVNGKSQGKKSRSNDDFPAAGLHWNVVLNAGVNHIKAVAYFDQTTLTDTITTTYQTEEWDSPSRINMSYKKIATDTMLVTAEILDKNGIRCLDNRSFIRFGLVGQGQLIDNLGTSTGSRKIETSNGVACIKIKLWGKCAISATEENLGCEILTFKP